MASGVCVYVRARQSVRANGRVNVSRRIEMQRQLMNCTCRQLRSQFSFETSANEMYVERPHNRMLATFTGVISLHLTDLTP